MILRRVINHFRKQEWTAIAIDLVIVVLGVFIGLQVNNWNEERRESALAEAYLDRLSGDLSAIEAYLNEMIEESSARYDLTVDLLKAASDRSGDDESLVAATEAFFTEGWKTPRFAIIDEVYKDLTSTGNLSLIEPELRQIVTSYYSGLDLGKERMEIGRDWSLPNDSRFIIEHDVYRWDLTLAALANAQDASIRRETIVGARDDLARLASMFLYIERVSLEVYNGALAETKAVTTVIGDARKVAP